MKLKRKEMSFMETEIMIYDSRFKRIIGYDVVMSVIWFQYFQMRLQFHASQIEDPNFFDTLWHASINPTIIGITISVISIWICYSGLKILRQGKELQRIRSGTAFLLTMWWGVFLILELATLAIYALNLGNLSTGVDIIIDLIQSIIDPIINAFLVNRGDL